VVAENEIEKQVRLLLNNDNADGALQLVNEKLVANPQNQKLLCLHGALLSVHGDEQGARADYELALSYEPDGLEAHSRLVDSYGKTDELEELRVRYEQLKKDEPFNAGVRLALALIYARTGHPDDSIQQGLEAVRLAPNEELTYMALAEGQRSQAFDLLRSNWERAWLAFQDFASTSFKLMELGREQKGQWCALTGMVFEKFAVDSHFSNPPLTGGGLESREIVLLAMAANFNHRAMECDPWRNSAGVNARVYDTIRALAKPDQMTMAAGHLRLDGWLQEAIMILILSLQADPDQAEANFELAQLTFDPAIQSSQKVALDYLRKAIQLDPNNQKYKQTELYFQRAPLSQPKEPDDEK
jgi:tetratricopeptide (TPR) repeat protein